MGKAGKFSSAISGHPTSEEEEPVVLPGIIQWWLAVFAFFLAFPAIDFAGLSITFYVFFLVLVIHTRRRITIITSDNTNKWFILLFIAGTIGTIAHPHLNREVSFLSDLKTIAQYAYWILLAMYIRSNYSLIYWWRISKGLLLGLCALVLGYYFFPFKTNLLLFDIHFGITRNGFVYNLLAFFPLIFLYLKYIKLPFLRIVLLLAFLSSVLFSNGRAGFLLIILEALLIGLVVYPKFRRAIKISLIFVMVVFIIWKTNSNSRFITGISQNIENINSRTSAMINKEGTEGDLTRDKSWLLRKLMVDKSLEIFEMYPVLGIGWMHFEKYDAQLITLDKYPRLRYLGKDFLNTRSSHNSYTMYLAEGGIIGFILLIMILINALVPFFKKLFRDNLMINDLPLIAMVILAIYFYVIASITGANTWFVIGLSLGALRNGENVIREDQ